MIMAKQQYKLSWHRVTNDEAKISMKGWQINHFISYCSQLLVDISFCFILCLSIWEDIIESTCLIVLVALQAYSSFKSWWLSHTNVFITCKLVRIHWGVRSHRFLPSSPLVNCLKWQKYTNFKYHLKALCNMTNLL